MSKLFILSILLFGVHLSSVHAKVMILNGLAHENAVMPGQSYTEYIEVYNGSDKVENILIYQRDYRFLSSGESFYDEPGSLSRSNARWIKTGQKSFVLQPGEKVNIPVQVNVPGETSLVGSYWSIIMVEKVDPVDPNQQKGIQIKSVIRYGIQIITHIGSTGLREINFAGTNIVREDSVLYLQVLIENTGERMLRHTIGMEVFTMEGKKVTQLEAQLNRTFPGTSTSAYLDIGLIPPGKYNVVLVADCENEDIFGTNMQMEIPDENGFIPANGQLNADQKPSRAKENEEKPTIDPNQSVWGIQVGYSKKKPKQSEYSKLTNAMICKCPDGYRIFSAKAANPQDLEVELEKVKKSGFRNAWINKIDLSRCDCN
ncbi:MAG TPA: hypothetical protein PLU49_01525 [Saprospiraceae bacterium]|nr:hypothetical protein [Saprospiraceae bacterium]